jgi:hypothetical protein
MSNRIEYILVLASGQEISLLSLNPVKSCESCPKTPLVFRVQRGDEPSETSIALVFFNRLSTDERPSDQTERGSPHRAQKAPGVRRSHY